MRLITVLAPSFVLTAILAIVPALARIADAFPEASQTAVQMLVTLPPLVAVPMILISGVLAGITTKKRISLVSLVLMLIGGLLPVFFYQSFSFLLFCAVIFGVGLGGISPMTIALVHEHYPGQATILGYTGSVLCVGGVVLSLVGGWLASYHWRYAYLTYLLVIPIIILVMLLPKGAVVKSSVRFSGLFSVLLVYYLIQCIITSVAYNTFNANIAMYIKEIGLGDARTAGVITAIYSAVGIVGGILTGHIMGKFKKYTLTILFAISAIGMLCICLGHSMAAAVLGTLLVGFAFSVYMPAGYTKATQSAPVLAATLAISVYCAANQLGQFLNPLIINTAAKPLGGSMASKFLLSFLILTIMFFVSYIWERKKFPMLARPDVQ